MTMANGNGTNGTFKWILGILSGVVVVFLSGWVLWVSQGLVEAKVDKERICTIQTDVAEIKADVKAIQRILK